MRRFLPIILGLLLLLAAPASAANLLFMSDFGGTVAMGVPTIYSTRGWWPVTGGDDGFTWPIVINGGSTQGFQPISYRPSIVWNASTGNIDCVGSPNYPCWRAEIIAGTRHDGTTGPVLHRAQYQNSYWQFPYVAQPGSDVKDEYQSIWMMLPSNLATALGSNGWYTFSEWKTASTGIGNRENYDYRWILFIYTDSRGNPYWDMQGSEHSTGPNYFEDKSHAAVPLGRWFHYEVAWHRTCTSGDWIWVKIDGVQIMRQDGGGDLPGFCNGPAPINRIFISQIYGAKSGNVGVPTEQWTDHIEVWDGVPNAPPASGSARPRFRSGSSTSRRSRAASSPRNSGARASRRARWSRSSERSSRQKTPPVSFSAARLAGRNEELGNPSRRGPAGVVERRLDKARG